MIRTASAQLQNKQTDLTAKMRNNRDLKIQRLKTVISEKREKLRQLSAVENFAKKNYCPTTQNAMTATKLASVVSPNLSAKADNIDSAADQNPNNNENENNTENLIISSSENLNSENQTDNIFKNVRKNLVNENISNTDQLPLSAKNNNNNSNKPGDIINNDNTIEIDIKPLLKLIDNISFMQRPESPLILMPNYDKNDNFLEIRFVNSLQYISVDFYVIEYAIDGNQDDFFKEETKDNFVRILSPDVIGDRRSGDCMLVDLG